MYHSLFLGEASSELRCATFCFGRYEPKAYVNGVAPPAIDSVTPQLIWKMLKVIVFSCNSVRITLYIIDVYEALSTCTKCRRLVRSVERLQQLFTMSLRLYYVIAVCLRSHVTQSITVHVYSISAMLCNLQCYYMYINSVSAFVIAPPIFRRITQKLLLKVSEKLIFLYA